LTPLCTVWKGNPFFGKKRFYGHKVLRRMALGLKKEEVTRGWRKLQYGEIHNLLFSVIY
jgi:hypothetical protein